MKYTKLSLQFLKHNFWSTILWAIIPAGLFALLTNPCSIFEFALTFDVNDIDGFFDVYSSVNEGTRSWLFVFLMCVTFLLTCVIVSAMVGNVQNKMRFGEIKQSSWKNFVKSVNNNFLAVFFCFFAVCVFSLLFGLVNGAFAYFYINKAARIAAGLIITTYLLIFIALMFISCWFIIMLPLMTIKGFGIKLAIAESSRLVAHNFGKVLLSVIIPLLVLMLPNIILASINAGLIGAGKRFVSYYYIKVIVSFITYLFTFAYYITLMFASFFEMEDIEREDIKNLNQWRNEEC